jgi:pSer/pThr/pTyr-binding forkhead associated (FHA) protein
LACEKLRKTFADDKAAILDALSHLEQQEKQQVDATAELELDVTLTATTGPYTGQTWTVKPRPGKAVIKIGRSTGKTFAVSLPEDDEVSTTHGKIELKTGRVFFTDLQSTNGSFLNGSKVEARDPVVLSTDDILTVGATKFVVVVSHVVASDSA